MRAPWMALTLTVAWACAEPATAPERPVLRVAGSQTMMARLVPSLAETHDRSVGSLGFELRTVGETEALRMLLDGEIDMAAVTRRHTPAEEEQAQADGYSLEAEGARNIVAVDVVAIAVHPSNSIESLTYDQVIGIFCTGSIDNWSFLGMDDQPIHAVTRSPEAGSRILFEDFFCGPRGLHRSVAQQSVEAIHATLASDPAAISYLSLPEIEGKAKVLGLRPDRNGAAMLPSQHNIIRGMYPLYHDLYLYTRGPAAGEAAEFLVWIASPAGQEVVDEERFVPLFLRPERLDEPRPLRETIQFEAGSSDPNLRSEARLALLVEELRDRAGEVRHVVLEGYADNQEEDPEALSKARAEHVRDILVKELPDLYFEIIPRGSANPIAPNETPYGRLRNRRVQVYLAEEELATEGATTTPAPPEDG